MKRLLRLTILAAALVASFDLLVLRASAPPASNTWTPAGDMTFARAGAASALLYDGHLLVTGGMNDDGVSASAERYSQDAQGFLSAAPMHDARANHTATMLPNGRVLVAGGVGANGRETSAAEVYDPATNVWTAVAPMYHARSGHTATALFDGRVVVMGGTDGDQALDSIEVFDPSTGVFALSNASLTSPRAGHAAAQLYDGTLLVSGGFDGTQLLASVDRYDPFFDTVAADAAMKTARAGHSATTLLNGDMLVAGGAGSAGDLASGEVYGAAGHAFRSTGNGMSAARQRHQAFLLPHNNQVLFVGGTSNGTAVATAEVYVAWQGNGGTFVPTAAPSTGRAWATGGALSFNAGLTIRSGPHDGVVVLAGGSAAANAANPSVSSELYNFATVQTDLADYPPGHTVTIAGGGWQPGESVSLTLVEDPLHDVHVLEPVTADDSGNIISTEFAPDQYDLNIKFYLTATGGASQAQTSFTDAACTWKTSASDGNWFNGANWTGCTGTGTAPNRIPGAADDLTIPTAATSYPAVTSGTALAKSLLINSGASVTVTGGTVTVSGSATTNAGGSLTVSGGTFATTGKVVNHGTLNLSSGTIDDGDNLEGTGTFNVSGGLFKMGHDMKATTFSASGGTFEFAASAGGATFPTGTYTFFNVLIDSGVQPKFAAHASVNVHVKGNWTNNSSTSNVDLTSQVTTVTFDGSAAQTIGGSAGTEFNNLTIANAAGVSLTTDAAVESALAFTSGNLTTASHTVTVGTSATTGSVSAAGGHVVGNLKKFINNNAAQSTKTFEVGTAAFYSPVTLTPLGAPAGAVATSALLVSVVDGDHANLAASGINGSRSVNSYWSVVPVGGTAWTLPPAGYAVSAGFVAGDVDGGANTSNFVVKRLLSGTWNATTTGARTATSTQATVSFGVATNALSAFGDFAIGEIGGAATATSVGTATVATSAIEGKITDPRKYLN